jgi:hypothetical protein
MEIINTLVICLFYRGILDINSIIIISNKKLIYYIHPYRTINITMGCSQSLIEYIEKYETGELKIHNYKLNDKWCGPFKRYYTNGELLCVSNGNAGNIYGRYLQFYENGHIHIDTYMYNCYFRNYKIKYDINESMTLHIIYDNPKNKSTHSNQLRAEYVNNTLCSYHLRDGKQIYVSSRIIYNTSPKYDFMIDLSVINPIRTFQRLFRQHMYRPIFNELNHVICVNDISNLIILYLTKN